MANKMKDAREKKTVPVNILLTEDANVELSKFALQASTATMRLSKSDIVRATLQVGLPLFDLVHKLTPEVPISQVPDILTSKPVIEAVTTLAQERASVSRTRGAVRTRSGIRTRGGTQGEEPEGIELVAPVNTGVHQAPTFAWKLSAELIATHLKSKSVAPIRCSVLVLEDEQEVWGDHIDIALPRGARPEQEAQTVRSLPMPPEVFEQLSPLSWKRWTVQVSYQAGAGERESKASALFLRVAPYQAARATVEGFVAQGHAYEAQGLLEESTTFFRDALETSCQQLVALYRMRGLPQAEEYEKLLEELTRLQ